MKDATLVIMAAGMGSRYGGLKQLDPVGPNGEIIIDYSIFDAIKAGFNKIVFIIKKELLKDFQSIIGNKIPDFVKTVYVFQDNNNILPDVAVPKDRKKPFGTAHAVLCCKNVINEPFAVINADDFYGSESFRLLYNSLTNDKPKTLKYDFYMVGYDIANTLTENGTVARGVCDINEKGELLTLTEHTKIAKHCGSIMYNEDEVWTEIPENSTVSMNCWGFCADIFNELQIGFDEFLLQNKNDLSKCEYFLPYLVDELVKQNKAVVNVLKTHEKWYGVTYKEDKPAVKAAVIRMIKEGKYPERLWK